MTEARDLAERLLKYASMPSCANPRLLNEAASALATPASDGLPEGWLPSARRLPGGRRVDKISTGGWVTNPYVPDETQEYLGPATMSLSEACLAANERFPVVKPEAPAKWVQVSALQWERDQGKIVVVCASRPGEKARWMYVVPKTRVSTDWPTSESAMREADLWALTPAGRAALTEGTKS